MVELASDPAVEGVFLYADLKALGIILGDGEKRGCEGDGGTTEAALPMKERLLMFCMIGSVASSY